MSCIVIGHLTLFLFPIQNNEMLYWIGSEKSFLWVVFVCLCPFGPMDCLPSADDQSDLGGMSAEI